MTVRRLLPPEWAPQSGVMLTWPHSDTDWAPLLAQVEAVYLTIAGHITAHEGLLIVCRDEHHRDHIQALLQETPSVEAQRVRFALSPSNDSWARDHGPITVIEFDQDRSQPRLLDFTFNGWGGKYAADLDNAISRNLHAQGVFGATEAETVPLVLEGGSIESDGAGTLLTTTRCLLSPTRNPELGVDALEQRLRESLGVQRVLWLRHGELAGDDTDAHIDTLARFCDPQTIAHMSCEDPNDEHYGALTAMTEELRRFATPHGTAYRLVPIPLPAPIRDRQGHRLPASYVNFLIINGAVLVPTYADPADAIALQRLGEAFPGREIIGIDCSALIQQYGSLHCITMQFPQGVLA